jgi:phosphatidylserine decarboxylase
VARRPRKPEAHTGVAHIAELLRSQIPPMHPAGVPFVGASLGLAALGRRHRWAWTAGLAAAAANAAFFRHPHRVPPTRPGAVVAPADGQICLIETAAPPPELGLSDEPRLRVSIFLSVLDAHVQRAPIGGEVTTVVHRPGLFGTADLPEASIANERNSIVIRTPEGAEVIAVQIAGLIARRIICDVKAGDKIDIGDTYGLIRYGSRLDTYLPDGSNLLVSVGQRAVGAETVLAELP